MTHKEAIEHGKWNLDVFGGDHREFIELAIEVLEKQISKKPKIKISERTCGICGTVIYKDMHFCSRCGQRIDWSEDKSL